MSEWKEIKISDIADVNMQSINKNFKFSTIEYIDTSSVEKGRLVNIQIISTEEAPSRAKRRIKKNDVLISSVRPNLEHYYFVESCKENTVVSTGFVVVSPKKATYPYFLYCLLTTDKYTQYLTQVANSHTSTYPSFNPDIIYDSSFVIPDYPEQKQIADVLSCLDDKIDNLRRQNETLEAIAQTLFKHWFIDFEFPDADGKPYKSSGGGMCRSSIGDVPEGWRFSRIGDEVETVGGGTPSTTELSYWKNGDIAWYSPTDLTKAKTLFSIDSEKKITSLGLQKSSARLFPKYSLLLTSRATIGEVTINTKDACTNQGFITIIPNERFSVYFLYGWLLTKIGEIKQLASGSTFPEISKTIFRGLDFLIPVNDVLENYEKLIKPIYKKIETNIFQIQTLTKTRDALLPKLMSGQLRIEE